MVEGDKNHLVTALGEVNDGRRADFGKQVMGVGRVRDLLSVPPERRALVEERLSNNRRRMTVDSLMRERAQGLTDVMLLLERASKAADGVPGTLVIEISTHRAPARAGTDGQLQGMVGRAVLFGVWDDVERAQGEGAMHQLASLLASRAERVGAQASAPLTATSGGPGGGGVGLADTTPLLNIFSTLLEAESVRVSVLVTISDSAAHGARNLEALAIARQCSGSLGSLPLDDKTLDGSTSAASSSAALNGDDSALKGMRSESAAGQPLPMPFPNWTATWGDTLREGKECRSPMLSTRSWDFYSSRSPSSRSNSPPKTLSARSSATTRDQRVNQERESVFAHGPVGSPNAPTHKGAARGPLQHGDESNRSRDSDVTVLFGRPTSSQSQPQRGHARTPQDYALGSIGRQRHEPPQTMHAPDSETRKERQKLRREKMADDDPYRAVRATEAAHAGAADADGSGKWFMSSPTSPPTTGEEFAADGEGGSRGRGVYKNAGDGRARIRQVEEEPGVNVQHKVNSLLQELSDAKKRAALAEHRVHSLECERKFQQAESEAVVDIAARQHELVQTERETLLARISDLETKFLNSSSTGGIRNGANGDKYLGQTPDKHAPWSAGKWRGGELAETSTPVSTRAPWLKEGNQPRIAGASPKWGVNEWASTAKVEQTVQTLRAETVRLTHERDKMQQRSKAADTHMVALERQLHVQQEAARERAQQLRSKSNDTEAELSQKSKRESELASNLNRRLHHLQNEHAEMAAAVEEERSKASVAQQTTAATHMQMQLLEGELEQAHQDALQLQQARTAQQETAARLADLESLHATGQMHLQESKARVGSMEAVVEEWRARALTAEEAAQELEGKVKELTTGLSTSEERARAVQVALQESRERVRVFDTELAECRDKLRRAHRAAHVYIYTNTHRIKLMYI